MHASKNFSLQPQALGPDPSSWPFLSPLPGNQQTSRQPDPIHNSVFYAPREWWLLAESHDADTTGKTALYLAASRTGWHDSQEEIPSGENLPAGSGTASSLWIPPFKGVNSKRTPVLLGFAMRMIVRELVQEVVSHLGPDFSVAVCVHLHCAALSTWVYIWSPVTHRAVTSTRRSSSSSVKRGLSSPWAPEPPVTAFLNTAVILC